MYFYLLLFFLCFVFRLLLRKKFFKRKSFEKSCFVLFYCACKKRICVTLCVERWIIHCMEYVFLVLTMKRPTWPHPTSLFQCPGLWFQLYFNRLHKGTENQLKRYSLHYASVPLNYSSELVPGSKLNGKQVVISLEEMCPSVCISMVLQKKLISLN